MKQNNSSSRYDIAVIGPPSSGKTSLVLLASGYLHGTRDTRNNFCNSVKVTISNREIHIHDIRGNTPLTKELFEFLSLCKGAIIFAKNVGDALLLKDKYKLDNVTTYIIWKPMFSLLDDFYLCLYSKDTGTTSISCIQHPENKANYRSSYIEYTSAWPFITLISSLNS